MRPRVIVALVAAVAVVASLAVQVAPANAQSRRVLVEESDDRATVVNADRLPSGTLFLRPRAVPTADLLVASELPVRLVKKLEKSPVPPMVLSDFSSVEAWSAHAGIDGYVFRSRHAEADLVVHSLVAPAATLGVEPGQNIMDVAATDRVGGRAVVVSPFDISGGHDEDAPAGFRARWFDHGVRYIAQAVCDYPDEARCRSWFLAQLSGLGVAPVGNIAGDGFGRSTLRWIEQLGREEIENPVSSLSGSSVGIEVAYRSSEMTFSPTGLDRTVQFGEAGGLALAACTPVTSATRPGFKYRPEGCLRVCPECSNTGAGGTTGNPFPDTFVDIEWVFPISSLSAGNVHSWSQTQVYSNGGFYYPSGTSYDDSPPNFAMPWEDNLCEFRSGRGSCDHRGQDIRPPTNQDGHYPIVAVKGGTRTFTGNYPNGNSGIQIVRGNVEYFYLHGVGLSTKNNIDQGKRIGKVSDVASTSVHLHFAIENLSNGAVRNPYDSLRFVYQKRWHVAKDRWNNNGATCELNIYWDFDKARKKLENRNNTCGLGSAYRANGLINESRFSCVPGARCHRVYFDSKCGSPNVAASSFDPDLPNNYVGDGERNGRNRVFAAQYDLYQAGYNPSWNLDCAWGSTTRGAVNEFQSCNDLTVDGKIRQETWGEMVDGNKTQFECAGP